ncbi:MAG: 30S ribosomal protein S6 [Chlamydiae bacterium]|nr:30S ribosomal protein S6 [Chlamydiota bacterium]MBI3277554.1 30S ribosomal protein S6 [Chlamydiota bacterium]
MKHYEAMVILDPTVVDAEAEKLVKGFESELVGSGGSIVSRDLQGKRALAYKVKGFREGIYALLLFQAPSDGILKIEKKFKITPQVLRYLLIKN